MLRRPVVRSGEWRLLECLPAWKGNWTVDCFIAFAWQGPNGERLLVAVNYASNQSQCYVNLPFADLNNCSVQLRDLLSSAHYRRDGNELLERGLYLDIPPWSYHVFDMEINQRT